VFVSRMSGIFILHLWLPLPFLPIAIEIELADYSEAFAPMCHAPGAAVPVQMSQQWRISDARIYCDQCTLDASLQSSYICGARS